MIVDSHCHLDMLTDIDDVIQRAYDSGVKYMQTICTRLDNFPDIIAIANKYDNIYSSVGIHPSEVRSNQEDISYKLLELSSNKKVIGIGETGLDYFYNKDESQQELQRISFKEHIIASQKNKLPVIIHTRSAENDTIDIISSNKNIEDFPALIHCFTASKDFARNVLDLGLYISISGIITFKNADELRGILQYIPLDRLLIETDSPYLSPVPKRGKTNEPSYLKYILEFLSESMKLSKKELSQKTTENFFNLFSKADRIDP